MKVIVVARRFDEVAGGVQRSASFLMNALAERGHKPVLLTWDRADSASFYEHHDCVQWERLDDGGPELRASWMQRVRRSGRIRRVIRGHAPDVVVAFQQGPFLTIAVSLYGSGIPVVAAERNAPTRFDHTRAGRWRNLIFLTFLMARRVVVQFERYRRLYPWYLRRRIATVPNPIHLPTQLPPMEKRANVILFVGRLSYQKDPATLVRAFAMLSQERPGWVLRLVGQDGERAADVGDLVREMELDGVVEMPGTTRDMDVEYAQASVLCLPSLWEGFPNAAGEAMAHGVPVVGFSDCAGLSDLVRHEREGLLAREHTPAALATELRRVMGDVALRHRLGADARRRAAEFSPEAVTDAWETLLLAAGTNQ